MAIKNIIFDVGNVLVRWAPLEIIASVFPQLNASDFLQKMRPIWIELNLGRLSETEAIKRYHELFDLPTQTLTSLMDELKFHQLPLEGSIQLLDKLQGYHIHLFSITDNVQEIMEYHKTHSDFPKYFKDIIVSSEVGILKPAPEIYTHLLTKHDLKASESVFIDDLLPNVEGAIHAGMHAFQFIDHASCEKEIMRLLLELR